jgi:hypothetical protein
VFSYLQVSSYAINLSVNPDLPSRPQAYYTGSRKLFSNTSIVNTLCGAGWGLVAVASAHHDVV